MKIDEIIVVEGRDDTAAVKRAAECETIETHGFGISGSTWKSLERAYKAKGLIILTDPDHAGDTIRRKIKERFPDAREAFLPRRKADKNGDVGVENAAPEDIKEALLKVKPELPCRAAAPDGAGVRKTAGADGADGSNGAGSSSDRAVSPVTMAMMAAAGLTGAPDSRARRELLADRLGISYGNARSMLSHINAFGITAGEFNEALRAADDKADKK